MYSLLSQILDVVFPRKVEVAKLEELAKSGRLDKLTPAFDTPKPWMKALFHYKDPKVRALVLEIKYSRNKILLDAVATLLYEEIISLAEDYGAFAPTDWAVVAVPTGNTHAKEKGFNQAEDLAMAIAKIGGNESLGILKNGLEKVRETEAQIKVRNRHARLNNLHDSFRASADVAGKNIIVIDDVITTGATMTEAKRALKEADAKKVIVFAIAH
jgi:ComF family protein